MINTKKINDQADGFTIIEVIIVLAIGGLIILTTLYAIPTLLRNSNNNQRKQDVATVLDAVSSYALNNSGSFPSGSSSNFNQISSEKLYTYEDDIVYDTVTAFPGVGGIRILSSAATNNESNTNLDVVMVYNYRKCNPDSPGSATTQGAGFRDVVGLYAIETGSGGPASKCIQA